MDITQTFYDSLASQYDKLFEDWNAAAHEQAVILDRIFRDYGFDATAAVLDCACGIGTQSIGLAALGYRMTASDISNAELAEAAKRAAENNVSIVAKSASASMPALRRILLLKRYLPIWRSLGANGCPMMASSRIKMIRGNCGIGK